MSRYFARLVQRATGMEQKTQAAPAPSSSSRHAGSEAQDPFEAVAPLQPPPASARTEIAHTQRPESTALRPPVEPQDLATAAVAPPPRPAALPVHAEAPLNPPLMQPQPAPRMETSVPATTREAQSLEQPQSATAVEPTRIERETVREVVNHAPDKSLKPVLLPAPPSRITPAPEKPPSQAAAPVFVQQPAGPVPERTSLELSAPLKKEPAKMSLDPRPALVPVPRQEPRLVIGRMQVEIVPSAPVPAAQPRVIDRRPAAPRASSAPSQLHFGLGQM